MKKLLLSLTLLSVFWTAQSQTILTHSTTETIMAGNSVSCSASGIVQDNYLMRRFDLDDFGIVDTAWIINMKFGVESSTVAPYKVRARVYRLTNPTFTLTYMSYIIGDTLDCIVDGTQYYLETDFPQGNYALPGDTLIGEVYSPTDAAAGFWMGSNNYYESDTSFMMAPGCGYFAPTPVHDIGAGFPNSHWLIFVEVNQRPKMTTVVDWVFKNDTLEMDKAAFHTANLDEDLDTLTMITVQSLPLNGVLEFMGSTVAIGDTILNGELENLLYIPTTGYTGLDSFLVKGRDKYLWTLEDATVQIEVKNFVSGISEEEVSWSINPNPVIDEMIIAGFDQVKKIQVFDMNGKKIYYKNMDSNTVNLSFLNSGTYILDVLTEKGKYTKQFVKQ